MTHNSRNYSISSNYSRNLLIGVRSVPYTFTWFASPETLIIVATVFGCFIQVIYLTRLLNFVLVMQSFWR